MVNIGEKPIAMFRTKADILVARDLNNIQIAAEVIDNPIFIAAKMQDMLGFKVLSGSDYTVIDVTDIKDNPKAFLEHAFGKKG